jgi:hypothetical protein
LMRTLHADHAKRDHTIQVSQKFAVTFSAKIPSFDKVVRSSPMKTCLRFCLLFLTVCAGYAFAQQSPPGPSSQEGRAPGRRFAGVSGQITEISGSTLKVKQPNGSIATVTVTGDTRFRKDRQEAKLSDFKVGDNVRVAGEPTGENSWTARMIGSAPSQADMQGAQQRFKDAMGKTVVMGEVKSIDAPKLTIERVDGVEQTIEADENTSFRRGGRFGGGGGDRGDVARPREGSGNAGGNATGASGGENITLPDIKAGDTIIARGELKNGLFVPSSVNVVDPEMARRMKEGGGMFFGGAGPRGDRGAQPPAAPQTAPKQ